MTPEEALLLQEPPTQTLFSLLHFFLRRTALGEIGRTPHQQVSEEEKEEKEREMLISGMEKGRRRRETDTNRGMRRGVGGWHR